MRTLEESIKTVGKFAEEILNEAEKRGFTIVEVEMLPGYIKNKYQNEKSKETFYIRKPQE